MSSAEHALLPTLPLPILSAAMLQSLHSWIGLCCLCGQNREQGVGNQLPDGATLEATRPRQPPAKEQRGERTKLGAFWPMLFPWFFHSVQYIHHPSFAVVIAGAWPSHLNAGTGLRRCRFRIITVNGLGLLCWAVLQQQLVSRCSFCRQATTGFSSASRVTTTIYEAGQ